MKKIIGYEGKEIEVTKYEPTAGFLAINTMEDLDLDDLWTDEEGIFTWEDAAAEYVRIWDYI